MAAFDPSTYIQGLSLAQDGFITQTQFLANQLAQIGQMGQQLGAERRANALTQQGLDHDKMKISLEKTRVQQGQQEIDNQKGDLALRWASLGANLIEGQRNRKHERDITEITETGANKRTGMQITSDETRERFRATAEASALINQFRLENADAALIPFPANPTYEDVQRFYTQHSELATKRAMVVQQSRDGLLYNDTGYSGEPAPYNPFDERNGTVSVLRPQNDTGPTSPRAIAASLGLGENAQASITNWQRMGQLEGVESRITSIERSGLFEDINEVSALQPTDRSDAKAMDTFKREASTLVEKRAALVNDLERMMKNNRRELVSTIGEDGIRKIQNLLTTWNSISTQHNDHLVRSGRALPVSGNNSPGNWRGDTGGVK